MSQTETQTEAATGSVTNAGALCWTEIRSTDEGATRKFLGDVFGWAFEPMESPGGQIHTWRTPGGDLGHIAGADAEGPGALDYLLVDDIDAAAQAVQAAGAEILVPRQDMPMGSFIVFTAPGGLRMAAWQNA
jgi:hypothetical protein